MCIHCESLLASAVGECMLSLWQLVCMHAPGALSPEKVLRQSHRGWHSEAVKPACTEMANNKGHRQDTQSISSKCHVLSLHLKDKMLKASPSSWGSPGEGCRLFGFQFQLCHLQIDCDLGPSSHWSSVSSPVKRGVQSRQVLRSQPALRSSKVHLAF